MLHANFDDSKQGAAFLSKNSLETTRAQTIRLVRGNPEMDKDVLFDKFKDLILCTKERQRDVDWYFFANAYAAAQAPEYNPQSVSQRAVRQEAVKSAAAHVVNQISLLFLTMPNGKAMRYCTGREMEKFGKGYAKIAKKAGAKTVGEVMNESEVRLLMDA